MTTTTKLITITSLLSATILVALAYPQSTTPARDPQAVLHNLGARNVGVHDPSAINKCKDDYWIFFTGNGTPSIHSKDLITWERCSLTVPAPPDWVAKAVP